MNHLEHQLHPVVIIYDQVIFGQHNKKVMHTSQFPNVRYVQLRANRILIITEHRLMSTSWLDLPDSKVVAIVGLI